MNKKILQNITNLAKFIFDESEYNRFIKSIKTGEFNSARLILDEKITELELMVHLDEEDDVLLSQYKQADKLMDVILDIMERAYGEGEQVKRTI